MVVFSASTTLAGEDSVRPRHRVVTAEDGIRRSERYKLHVKRPLIVQQLFDAFGAIDHHDQLRQGFLSPEASWLTKIWVNRVFSSIWGMCITDAYLAYRFAYEAFHGNLNKVDSLRIFTGQLAIQIIRSANGTEKSPGAAGQQPFHPVAGQLEEVELPTAPPQAMSNRHLTRHASLSEHPKAATVSTSNPCQVNISLLSSIF
jgi:hypothetical protein